MKIFEKKKEDNRRTFYIFGKKVLSYKKKQSKYDKIYAKRFKGLTRQEERYILEVQFERMAGYKLNLDNPQTFNEKIQWLKHNYRDPLMTKCADKVRVREYIKEKIGEDYLIPCLGVYNSPEEIDFDKLPDRFVLKVNWGSGQNIIVKDKSKLNTEEVKEKLKNWMKPESNHYFNFLEWVYKDIEPKIITEKYIEQMDGNLIDYKFFCNCGKPVFLFLGIDRFIDTKFNFYDLNWNLLPVKNHYKNCTREIPKPKNFEKMLQISEKLSVDFPFVRVDLFEIENKIYFGELTFYHFNGTEPFEPFKWDYKFGELIELQKRSNNEPF